MRRRPRQFRVQSTAFRAVCTRKQAEKQSLSTCVESNHLSYLRNGSISDVRGVCPSEHAPVDESRVLSDKYRCFRNGPADERVARENTHRAPSRRPLTRIYSHRNSRRNLGVDPIKSGGGGCAGSGQQHRTRRGSFLLRGPRTISLALFEKSSFSEFTVRSAIALGSFVSLLLFLLPRRLLPAWSSRADLRRSRIRHPPGHIGKSSRFENYEETAETLLTTGA